MKSYFKLNVYFCNSIKDCSKIIKLVRFLIDNNIFNIPIEKYCIGTDWNFFNQESFEKDIEETVFNWNETFQLYDDKKDNKIALWARDVYSCLEITIANENPKINNSKYDFFSQLYEIEKFYNFDFTETKIFTINNPDTINITKTYFDVSNLDNKLLDKYPKRYSEIIKEEIYGFKEMPYHMCRYVNGIVLQCSCQMIFSKEFEKLFEIEIVTEFPEQMTIIGDLKFINLFSDITKSMDAENLQLAKKFRELNKFDELDQKYSAVAFKEHLF